jgi:rare lipoprotein A (peptidoglycan hydrolase)
VASVSRFPLVETGEENMNLLVLVLVATVGIVQPSAPKITTQTVVASWYGPGFYGKEMANGETFGSHHPSYTVAHKSLPMGTTVILTNPNNNLFVIATVRDRGPFKRGRDFDLIEDGAKILGFEEAGIASLVATFYVAPPNRKV